MDIRDWEKYFSRKEIIQYIVLMLTLTTGNMSLMVDWDGDTKRVKCMARQTPKGTRRHHRKHCQNYLERESIELGQYSLSTYICVVHRRKLHQDNLKNFVGGYHIVRGCKPDQFKIGDYEKQICVARTDYEKSIGMKVNINWQS